MQPKITDEKQDKINRHIVLHWRYFAPLDDKENVHFYIPAINPPAPPRSDAQKLFHQIRVASYYWVSNIYYHCFIVLPPSTKTTGAQCVPFPLLRCDTKNLLLTFIYFTSPRPFQLPLTYHTIGKSSSSHAIAHSIALSVSLEHVRTTSKRVA